MRNHNLILTIILLSTILPSFGQKLVQTMLPVEIGGVALEIGDQLIIYEPKDFQINYESIYTDKKLNSKSSRFHLDGDEILDNSISLFSIDNFYRTYDNTIYISTRELPSIVIDIEKAFETMEVMTLEAYTKKFPEQTLSTNDSSIFSHFIKHYEGDPSEFWGQWLCKFRHAEYQSTYADEFAFYEARQKAGKYVLEASKSTNITDSVYSASVSIELDDYDFSSNSFKIRWGNSSDIVDIYDTDSLDCAGILNDIKLDLSEVLSFETIDMPFERAKSYIAYRTEVFGSEYKKVHALINFKITDELLYENGTAKITGDLLSVELYADKNYLNGYIVTFEK